MFLDFLLLDLALSIVDLHVLTALAFKSVRASRCNHDYYAASKPPSLFYYLSTRPALNNYNFNRHIHHLRDATMADCGFFPICIQCGTDQNPCHVKIVGPTLGFIIGVLMAVRRNRDEGKTCDIH